MVECLRLNFHIIWSVASDPSVHSQFVTNLATEKLVDGYVQLARFEVPQCDIDSCKGTHEDGAAAVEGSAPRHLPYLLNIALDMLGKVVRMCV
jgi:hypothetical protein